MNFKDASAQETYEDQLLEKRNRLIGEFKNDLQEARELKEKEERKKQRKKTRSEAKNGKVSL